MSRGEIMLEVKEAVQVSISTFANLFPTEKHQDLHLEEVKLSADENSWIITVSYKNPDLEEELRVKRADNNLLNPFVGGGAKVEQVHTRHYKSISIKATDGKLMGIMNA